MARAYTKAPRAKKQRRTPIPSDLNGFLTAKDKDSFLAKARESIVADNDKDDSRPQDIIHPSEMCKPDWCPRGTFLRIKTGVHHKQKFGFNSLNIFDTGHEVHRKWQNRAWKMGWLEGNWKCLHCRHLWWDLSPKRCHACDSRALEYAEVPLKAIDTHCIAGHSDGMLTPVKSLFEIKTLGEGTVRFEEPKRLAKYAVNLDDGTKLTDLNGMFGNLKTPFPSHIKQGQIYLWLARRGSLDVDKMTYLYEAKWNQTVKEFTVRYNPDIIQPLLDTAEEINTLLPEGKAPKCPQGGCSSCEPYTENADEKTARRRSGKSLLEDPEEDAQTRADNAAPAGRRNARASGRPDRPDRRRADEPVRGTDQVGRVRRNAAGDRSSRREGSRRNS